MEIGDYPHVQHEQPDQKCSSSSRIQCDKQALAMTIALYLRDAVFQFIYDVLLEVRSCLVNTSLSLEDSRALRMS